MIPSLGVVLEPPLQPLVDWNVVTRVTMPSPRGVDQFSRDRLLRAQHLGSRFILLLSALDPAEHVTNIVHYTLHISLGVPSPDTLQELGFDHSHHLSLSRSHAVQVGNADSLIVPQITTTFYHEGLHVRAVPDSSVSSG